MRLLPTARRETILLAVWFVGVSIPLAPLALQHMMPLARQQTPATSGTSAKRIAIRHVLSADCACSRAVAEHLLGRRDRASSDVEEVWLMGGDDALIERLRRVGYVVKSMRAAAVRREIGVAGAPLLVVYGPDGRELYAGGYAPQRPRRPADIQLQDILVRLHRGDAIEPYPIYGCAAGDIVTFGGAGKM